MTISKKDILEITKEMVGFKPAPKVEEGLVAEEAVKVEVDKEQVQFEAMSKEERVELWKKTLSGVNEENWSKLFERMNSITITTDLKKKHRIHDETSDEVEAHFRKMIDGFFRPFIVNLLRNK